VDPVGDPAAAASPTECAAGSGRNSDGDECLLAGICEQRCDLLVTPPYCQCAPH